MKSLAAMILAITVATGLQGCASAIIASGGGSAAPAPSRSDQLITRDVNTALVKASDVRATGIRVTTVRGVVTLRGTVGSTRAIVRASEITRRIPGVKRVRNFLTVIQR